MAILSSRFPIFIIGIIILVGMAHFFAPSHTTSAKHRIGILQFASHPALDAAVDGFKKRMLQQLGNEVIFILRNAQGSAGQAQLIAQQFHQDQSLRAILAVATPAAQACAFIEKKRPIFITAVTDPTTAGLNKANTNLCGTADGIDAANRFCL
ncbi:hypothetical protein FJ365_00575 [Candidatus Dependentiae bacterium]|nr:hypothetical protein [Candidatus Dependentiae bacterium]